MVSADRDIAQVEPCRYYYRARSCRRGDKCKFSHILQRQAGEPSMLKKAPSRKLDSRLDPSSAEFKPLTQVPIADEVSVQRNSEQELCGICTEPYRPFAQQLNCNHYFCVDCLKAWRSMGEGANRKACPTCRAESAYIVVLSQPQKDAARLLAIQRTRDRLKKIPCKHFAKTSNPRFSCSIGHKRDDPPRPFCVFGDDCLYEHKINGKEYKFGEDLDGMKLRRKWDREDRHENDDPGLRERRRAFTQRQALFQSLRPPQVTVL